MKFNYIIDRNIDVLKEEKKNLKIFSKENFELTKKYLKEDSSLLIFTNLVMFLITVGTMIKSLPNFEGTFLEFLLINILFLPLVISLLSSIIIMFCLLINKIYYTNLIEDYEPHLNSLINNFEEFYFFVRDEKNYDVRLNLLYNHVNLARYKYSIESLNEFIDSNKDLIEMIKKNVDLCESENKKEVFNNYEGPSILLNLFNISFKNLNLDDVEVLENQTNLETNKILANNMNNELKNYLKKELEQISV